MEYVVFQEVLRSGFAYHLIEAIVIEVYDSTSVAIDLGNKLTRLDGVWYLSYIFYSLFAHHT